MSRINKGINILVDQSSVWLWVMFSFPMDSSVGVSTVVDLVHVVILGRVVALVTMVNVATGVTGVNVVNVVNVVSRIKIQLRIFY